MSYYMQLRTQDTPHPRQKTISKSNRANCELGGNKVASCSIVQDNFKPRDSRLQVALCGVFWIFAFWENFGSCKSNTIQEKFEFGSKMGFACR